MKTPDFAGCLTGFLTSYLPDIKNVSPNTILSYCDTFKVFLEYCSEHQKIDPAKLRLQDITERLILEFLDWLETSRGCSISTRNQRLGALRSFLQYAGAGHPKNLLEYQRILNIPRKKTSLPVVRYLSKEDVALILRQPDAGTVSGLRDLTLLALLYDSGARVQEICDLHIRDVRLIAPAHVHLHGKGRKLRDIPILQATTALLTQYMGKHRFSGFEHLEDSLFCNRNGEKLTRAGVAYILKKYANLASRHSPQILGNISPHLLRHTKAMHLLEADVNMLYIRDILGHEDVGTTGRYARANLKMKQTALEKIQSSPVPEQPSWVKEPDLLDWLRQLSKSGPKAMPKKE